MLENNINDSREDELEGRVDNRIYLEESTLRGCISYWDHMLGLIVKLLFRMITSHMAVLI